MEFCLKQVIVLKVAKVATVTEEYNILGQSLPISMFALNLRLWYCMYSILTMNTIYVYIVNAPC